MMELGEIVREVLMFVIRNLVLVVGDVVSKILVHSQFIILLFDMLL